MKSRNRIVLLTLICVWLASVGSAAEQEMTGWWAIEEKQVQLGLTAEQVEEIAAIEGRYRTKLIDLKKEKRNAYKNVIRRLDAEDMSDEDFAAAQSRIEAAYGGHAALSAERWRELRSVMTKKQWKKLPEVAPRVLALGSIATSFRGKVRMGEPQKENGKKP